MNPRVLLVGWDAADWKVIYPLVRAGKMPHVQRLMEDGATGQISTLHPPLSPMLWTSIATGKRPFQHGILGFSEPSADGLGVQPVTNLARKSKALWNILHQNDLRSVVIGWWPSHPAEPINGVMVSDHFHRFSGPLETGWPLLQQAVHPPELAKSLAALRVHPDQLTPGMLEPFIPLASKIDQDTDKRLGACMRTLAESMSINAAAHWLAENQPWDFFAVYYDSIDHFSHGFMKYHPPRRAWIRERDFELYREVVSMAYQFQDQMLGTLLEKAGEDTTVILMSDHGFHPGQLRPASIPDIPAGPAIEHRDFGILAMRGPGIQKGKRLQGASVLDVAPTILTIYGLPVGEDMDGKVLSQAFEKRPKTASIPSWEEVPGEDGRHPPHMRSDPIGAHEALEQMIALGYIQRPDENCEVAVAKAIRDLRFNLGEAYQDADRHKEAHAIFAELYAADADEQRFAVRLFVSCQALGKHEEMRRMVDGQDGRCYAQPVKEYLRAQVLMAEKRYPEALAAFEQITDADLVRPGVFLETAELYVRLGRCGDAQKVYEKALALDEDDARAHIGMCRLALRRRNFRVAAQWALDALERVHHYPLGHYLLGLALAGMKEYERAAEAFREAIFYNPNFPEAHVRLAGLLEKHLCDFETAREHRRLARCMRRGTRPSVDSPAATSSVSDVAAEALTAEMPALEKCLIVVTGLPRSGTSMVMQMLAAGGIGVLSDGIREADEDNPRGYLEYEPVKNLLQDSKWLMDKGGKAIKIVAPLLAFLPAGMPCRVILSERDIEEVLDSQERMLVRRGQSLPGNKGRRRRLKDEFARMLGRVKTVLARRPQTHLLLIDYGDAISNGREVAEKVKKFLGGDLDADKMAQAIDPRLHLWRRERDSNPR